jgi:cell division protein FtsA
LKQINKAGRLPAGVVLVGGGAKLPGLAELARQELKLPAQVGVPDISGMDVAGGELGFQAEDPEFASALGLIQEGRDKLSESKTVQVPFRGFFKALFRHLIP